MSEPRTWTDYVMTVVHAIQAKEPFDNQNTAHTATAASVVGVGIFTLVIVLLFGFLMCFGAAKLSWCYNIFYGASTSTAFLWSALCFLNPTLYYSFYALFLDPVCGRRAKPNSKNGV